MISLTRTHVTRIYLLSLYYLLICYIKIHYLYVFTVYINCIIWYNSICRARLHNIYYFTSEGFGLISVPLLFFRRRSEVSWEDLEQMQTLMRLLG